MAENLRCFLFGWIFILLSPLNKVLLLGVFLLGGSFLGFLTHSLEAKRFQPFFF